MAEPSFQLPSYSGRYIEPFLGGGAVFFHLLPRQAILSDINVRLIEAYQAVRDNHQKVSTFLRSMQTKHSRSYYYEERTRNRRSLHGRAAQFLYLNRACWNGLYRENLKGQFNVPIGTKTQIIFDDEDFSAISKALENARILVRDFDDTINEAQEGDLLFVDPPYTTAHNMNGFVKYNQNIFQWSDQLRLKSALIRAADRGAKIILTNADHESIHDLYANHAELRSITRASVISGKSAGRRVTSEAVYFFNT